MIISATNGNLSASTQLSTSDGQQYVWGISKLDTLWKTNLHLRINLESDGKLTVETWFDRQIYEARLDYMHTSSKV